MLQKYNDCSKLIPIAAPPSDQTAEGAAVWTLRACSRANPLARLEEVDGRACGRGREAPEALCRRDIYIYIYIERERDVYVYIYIYIWRERERDVYIYIYI